MRHKTINRRSFIGDMSKGLMLSTIPVNLSKSIIKESDTEEHGFLTEPYLQNMTGETVTIMWITSKKSLNWVEIVEPEGTVKKVFTVNHGLIQAWNRVAKIRIDKLKPGSAYNYSICSREIKEFEPYKVTFGKTIKKGVFTFMTPPKKEEKISFVVFNDLHDHPDNITELMEKFTKKEDYNFVVFNGDVFNWNDGEERIIKDLLIPSGKVFSQTHPFLMVQGNHEPRGNFAREMFSYFDYPEDRCYYAFTRGSVRFIVIDSGEDKEDDHVEYSGLISFDKYREQQAKWLEREIETKEFKNAAFRVVFIHIPVYHAGEKHGTLHCRQLFNPLFNKGKIDIAISGHTHRYGTFDADQQTHHYPIVIGGGPGFVGRGGGTRTIIKVKATAKDLLIEMLVDDGTVVGSYNLKK